MTGPNYHLHGETEALQPGHSYITLFPKHSPHAFLMCSHMLAKELGHGCPQQIHRKQMQSHWQIYLRPCWYCQQKLHGDYKKSVVMKFVLLSQFFNLE